MFLVGPPSVFDSGGYLFAYSQMSSPVAASSACTTLPGLVRYMMPSCTSGVPWLLPSRMVSTQASCSSPTLPRFTRASGLKPCPSPVRRKLSQSPGGRIVEHRVRHGDEVLHFPVAEAVRTLGLAGDGSGGRPALPLHTRRPRGDLGPAGRPPRPKRQLPDLGIRIRAQVLLTAHPRSPQARRPRWQGIRASTVNRAPPRA